MRKNKLSNFLFTSIILIVISVFVLYKSVSYVSDKYANTTFSKMAENYSAGYVFRENHFNQNENIEKITKLGGFILTIDNNGKIIHKASKIDIEKLYYGDIISLLNGTYKIDDIEYYASMQKIPNKEEYGLVILPSDIVSNVTMLTLGNEDIKYIVYFIIIRSAFLIPAIIILVFIFSSLLKRKLVQPLYNLRLAFNKLRNEDYSTTLSSESIDEFNDLNNSFKELSTTLEKLNEKEKEYKRKRNQLFSDISHDFKTPITVIKGYSEAILEKKIKNSEVDKYIKLIKKNADHLDKLTLELSDIVNYERHDYELCLKKIDLIEYFRRVVIDFLPVFEEKEITIVTDIPSDKFYYEIDEKLFYRVLQNLISNIIDHNPRGIDVLFKFEIIDKDIKKDIKIIIADSGVMINNDYKYDIFDEFKTYDESRGLSQNNNGLGLAIAKKIITLHRGKIYLDTNYNGYSKAFIITLFL